MTDGERLPLPVKDLGSCDLYPQSLQHNPNGRFVVVCGDGGALCGHVRGGGEAAWKGDNSVLGMPWLKSVGLCS